MATASPDLSDSTKGPLGGITGGCPDRHINRGSWSIRQVCRVCGREYANAITRRRHERRAHEGDQ